ncbi:MAG: hypothetical protein ACOC6Q_00220 [Patescibacteria group bacterium]
MALKKEWPSIRAEWLEEWLERGTIEAAPLLGLPELGVLVPTKGCRPQKTWYRKENGEVIKETTRYWLGEGVLLVSRWDSLEIHYDPKADQNIEKASTEELKSRRMFRLKDGTILVLIYQHVEDILHFQRQQWHIELDTYQQELEEIFGKLREVEMAVTALKRSRKESTRLPRRLRRRRKEIQQILLQAIVPREQAAEMLIETLWKEFKLAEEGIENSFASEPMKDFLAGEDISAEGLRSRLVNIYHQLNQMKVRPVVLPLRKVSKRYRNALGALDVGEEKIFLQEINYILDSLKELRSSLIQEKKQ